MSSVMEVYDYTPTLLHDMTADLKDLLEKQAVEQIVNLFYEADLPVKVKHLFPDTPKSYYRILCFIKKSAEAVIINTRNDLGKEGVEDGLNLQVRIVNSVTFDRLDAFTENVRGQITDANDCRFCSAKCEGKRYVFSYAGTEYTKCQYLCSNFRFTIQTKEDVRDIAAIVKDEIAYKKAKKKK